ncbi:MAG: hypothetical protein H6618_03020 [Deltaproteobacteria bacterium]|nr:hypothetical protein [Deltaproteobacteria bacterium]
MKSNTEVSGKHGRYSGRDLFCCMDSENDMGRLRLRIYLASIAMVFFNACGIQLFEPGSSVSSHGANPYFASKLGTSVSDKNLSAVVKVQALAIGNEAISKLAVDLSLAGMRQDQIDVVTESARVDLKAQVGNLALPDSSFALTGDTEDQSFDPVSIAMPFVISGSMKALSLSQAGVSDASAKSGVAAVILESSFSSLNGNVSHFDSSALKALSKSMAGQAVESLGGAGFDQSAAADAGFAVTSGAIAALRKAGIADEMTADIAGSIVSGAVSKLSTLDWGSPSDAAAAAQHAKLLSGVIAKISEGAVSSLRKATSSDEKSLEALSSIVGSAMEGIGSMKSARPEIQLDLQDAISSVSRGVVGRLKDAELTGSGLGSAMSHITSSMVGSLEKSGMAKEDLSKGIASVCSGSISGLSATGLSEQDIQSSGAIGQVMEGSLSSMGLLSLSELDRAGAMTLVVEEAIASIDDAGISDQSLKSEAVSHVLSGTVKSFAKAGLSSGSAVAVAVKNMTKGATNGLSAAGVAADQINDYSANIAKESIGLLVRNKVTQGSDSLQSLVGEVTKGVMEGIGAFNQKGALTGGIQSGLSLVIGKAMEAITDISKDASLESNLGLNDLATMSVRIASGATGGLALSGVESATIVSFQDDISSQISKDLALQGLGESELTLLNSQISGVVSSAVAIADAVELGAASYPECLSAWPDSDTNEIFYDKARYLPDPVLCRARLADPCPLPRGADQYTVSWIHSTIPLAATETNDLKLCEMLRTMDEEILPGSFWLELKSPVVTSGTFDVSWTPSAGAVLYHVIVASDAACTQPVKSYSGTAYGFSVTGLTDGIYYLCGKSENSFQKIFYAENSGTSLVVDSSAPASDSLFFSINNGESVTNSLSVSLYFGAPSDTEVYVTDDPSCQNGGVWESVPATKAWTLWYANSYNYIYAKFRDSALNESTCMSATILHDDSTQSNSGEGLSIGSGVYTTLYYVTLYPTSASASEMYITNDAACDTGGSWEPFSTVRPNWMLGQINSLATVYIRYRYTSGEVSGCISQSIMHDDIAPSGVSVFFTSGNSVTSSQTEQLGFYFDDAVEMYVTNDSSCLTGGGWEVVSAQKDWNLNIVDGIASVFAKFRDAAGNESYCTQNSINYVAPEDYTRIAGGFDHLCMIDPNDDLRCWGSGAYGQTGGYSYDLGDQPGELMGLPPVDMGAGRKVFEVDAGGYHTCALLDDGSVKCWGEGISGQTGSGSTGNIGLSPGDMGDALVAVDLGTGVKARRIAAGGHHSCAILDDDSLKCWGSNNSGQLGQGNISNIGDQPGEMGDTLPSVQLGTGRYVLQVAVGGYHTCALLDDHRVKCWGQNAYGQLGREDTQNQGTAPAQMGDNLAYVNLGSGRTALSVSAGFYHSCALLDDGTVKCWGKNDSGQLGHEDNLNVGDTVGSMGDNLMVTDPGLPANVSIVRLLSANYHNCVLLSDQSMKCWGANSAGELGLEISDSMLGATTGQMGTNLPALYFGGALELHDIGLGLYQSCAVFTNGELKCWGKNQYGTLGQGHTSSIGKAVGEISGLPPVNFAAP